jgi:hypothetical protein
MMTGHPAIAYMVALQIMDERRKSADALRARARATQPSTIPGTARSTKKQEAM